MRTFCLFLSVVLLTFSVDSLIATTIRVPADQPTIQAGINSAVYGDAVLISEGLYQEHDITFLGKAITVMSTDPENESVVQATIVDGGSAGPVFSFHSGETTLSVLTGLTIRSGNAGDGGGIYCHTSSPVLSHSWIHSNYARRGGGIYCYSCDPIISNCLINGNVCERDPDGGMGGGIFCDQSSPSVNNSLIAGNSVEEAGGGICCIGTSTPYLADCEIGNNTSEWTGGGADCQGANIVKMQDCIISGNDSFIGGAVLCASGAEVILLDCEIMHNVAVQGGGFNIENASATMRRCSITDNETLSDSGIHGYGAVLEVTNCTYSENQTTFGTVGFYCLVSDVLITNSILWNNDEIDLVLDACDSEVTYSDCVAGIPASGHRQGLDP